MIHKRFIHRQIAASGPQAAVFVLCVMLSVAAIVAVNGFRESVTQAILKDARTLHAADIIIQSYSPLSQPLLNAVADWEGQGRINSTRVHEFYSMVRAADRDASVLADLKVVEKGYPFYGEIRLASHKNFREVLASGHVIVEQSLLDRLGLKMGDQLHIGRAVLFIKDRVIAEPDRPVAFLSFGPRVFVSADDLDSLDLMKKGSRVKYRVLLKLAEGESPEQLAAVLEAAAMEDQERVETFRTASSRVKRFFDNFFFYLALTGIFTLILSGLGIRSTLTAYLKEREMTVAVIKALGGTSRFTFINYLAVILSFGAAGTLMGLIGGVLIEHSLPLMFGDLLPADMELVMSWRAVIEGIVLGVLTVALFAFLPLYRLRHVRPALVFRKAEARLPKGVPYYLTWLVILLFFGGMVLWQLDDTRTGLKFLGAIMGLILLTAVMTRSILWMLRHVRVRSLAPRQALRGLFRPGNSTGAVMITLSAAASVIFSLYLIEANLNAAFVRSYPPNAPNLFFIDIQPDQVDAFSDVLGIKTKFYPIIRSHLAAVNDQKIERKKELKRRGDNLARPFNLTYRDDLLEDEVIIKGGSLFQKDQEGLQVSVLDTVINMQPMKIGDRLTFQVQGVPVEAVISSIRSRTRESLSPYFYFVFPTESIIRQAPQTIFTSLRAEKNQIGHIQNRVVSRFPNISAIDVSQSITVFAGIAGRLSLIIRFFTAFSILAGVLILIGSIFATRFARVQEAVYYKILGTGNRFVRGIFALENLIIGLASAVPALAISQAGTWIICRKYFDIPYQPYGGASLLMAGAAVVLVMSVGAWTSRSILREKPAAFLREHAEE
jgi:putative ABC transport system permease protein